MRFLPECEKMSGSVNRREEEETRDTPSEAELRCESERRNETRGAGGAAVTESSPHPEDAR